MSFEDLRVYKLAEEFADFVWGMCEKWKPFVRDTVGRQLVRAVDSIGANIAEGSGRYHFQDNRRFVRIARGSLYETTHWLRRAYRRKLLTAEQSAKVKAFVEKLGPTLNAYLNSIGSTGSKKRAGKPRTTDYDGQMTNDE
jgi:four helix bundle protein